MLRRLVDRIRYEAADVRRGGGSWWHWAVLFGVGIGGAWITAAAETIEDEAANPAVSFILRSLEYGPTDHRDPEVGWKANTPITRYSRNNNELVEATVWVPPEVAQKLGEPDDSKVITVTVIYRGSHKKGHCSWEGGDWVCKTQ